MKLYIMMLLVIASPILKADCNSSYKDGIHLYSQGMNGWKENMTQVRSTLETGDRNTKMGLLVFCDNLRVIIDRTGGLIAIFNTSRFAFEKAQFLCRNDVYLPATTGFRKALNQETESKNLLKIIVNKKVKFCS